MVKVRYAYGITAALLLAGGTVTLVKGDTVTAQTNRSVSSQANLAPKGAPVSFADLTEQLQPAVVNISTKKTVRGRASFNPFTRQRSRAPEREQQGGGSGFIISEDGLIVTNNHVIASGARDEVVDEVTVTLFSGKEYKAEIIGRDAASDIALLKISEKDLPYVEMQSSLENRVGDWVIAIGNPLGLSSSVTAGIISALQRNIGAGGAYDRFIQTDTAINPGNSGGPLFNLQGKVIGINNRLISPIGANIGVGFAIPVEEALPVIEALKKGQRPERGYLGIAIGPVPADMADALGLEKEKGEVVGEVVKGEAADKGGIKKDDIILKIDGNDVTPKNTLSYQIANKKPGSKVKIDLLRRNKPVKLTLTVGTRPAEEKIMSRNFNPEEEKDFEDKQNEDSAKVLFDALGIRAIELTPQLADRINVPVDTKGVIINAGRGSAQSAGLRNGDVVVSVNYAETKNLEAFTKAISGAQDANKKAVLLGVKRISDKTQYVTVRLQK